MKKLKNNLINQGILKMKIQILIGIIKTQKYCLKAKIFENINNIFII